MAVATTLLCGFDSKKIHSVLFLHAVLASCLGLYPQVYSQFMKGGTFEVDYDNNTFVKDGKPFRYVAGSIHYTRVHPDYWEDRLIKIRASGLNAIQTVVPWNVHEPQPGQYYWDGFSDLPRFLSLAQKSDLLVLLRVGPYICAEWEFGGFPPWFLSENPDMVLRSRDLAYMTWVEKWMVTLLIKIKPYLYQSGGPVVMVQIENEYGSYFTCDHDYTLSLRDIVRKILGDQILIYTTDGSNLVDVTCGKVNQTYSTVDFGTTCKPENCFNVQRFIEPKGPLVNSEFYTGWLDHWGSPHSTTPIEPIIKNLDTMLAMGANVNMYMFHGGTNFGLTNGANYPPYQAVPTSYDYDAPITEEGDYHDKYLAIRDIVSKYLPLPSKPLPPHPKKARYGNVSMEFVCTVPGALSVLSPEGPYKMKHPVNMEQLKFYGGFVLYQFILEKDYPTPTNLSSRGIRDRAMVMVDTKPFGILDRVGSSSVNITGTKGQRVDILVENQGYIGFGTQINFNLKGITADVTLNNTVVENWLVYPIHLENIDEVSTKCSNSTVTVSDDGSLMTPSFYMGNLLIANTTGKPTDTFLDPRPFTKGQAFINGFNLGRYWPDRGPQITLYVPKPVLTTNKTGNALYLMELEYTPCHKDRQHCSVYFSDTSILNATVHADVRGHALEQFSLSDLNAHRVH